MAYSTLRVVAELDNGTNVGTGFFYQFFSTNQTPVPALITNKHVLKNARAVTLIFNPARENNRLDYEAGMLPVNIPDFGNSWIQHPDLSVDLAFIPLARVIDTLAKDGKYPFMATWRRDNFPKLEEWNSLTGQLSLASGFLIHSLSLI
jgi:hypothetical protein